MEIAAHCDLAKAPYQKLVNLVSNVWNSSENSFDPLMLPHGTKMPKLSSKRRLLNMKKEIGESLGLEVGYADAIINNCCSAVSRRVVI
jgi:hypothetical protein